MSQHPLLFAWKRCRHGSVARSFIAIVISMGLGPPVSAEAPSSPDPTPPHHTTEIDGFTFQVRDGYELSKIAGAGLVTRPTVCDWDDQGRLVTVSSAGAKGSVEDQLESKPHQIVRLIDADGDGVFDRQIVAADNLSFYSGVLCHGNDIFVSAPPSIWKLTDADGDGVCESREVWHDGGTITYCANDLHGPYAGPDGWIYWCKGAFGKQTHELTDGSTLISKAAQILRKRPEGGQVEIITSGGMDNPIELVFLPNGERFFTSTFLQHPGDGRRDGIAHAVHGSVFGKRHHVIDGLPRTGDLMPVMTHLGPAAPTGLMRRNADSPSENVLICGQFNTHRVTQHTLVPDGATYRTIDEDLVTCDRLDFHPTDVTEDADGSIVFLDTGDWYDLCCPSSGAEGQRSLGGVYRLRPTTGHAAGQRKRQALFKTIDWDALTNSGLKAAMADDQTSDLQLIRIAWAIARRSGEDPSGLFYKLLTADRSAEVRHAALMAAMHTPALDHALVSELLATPNAGTRRAAAQWLGKHGDADSVPPLMEAIALADRTDQVLLHSLRYALIDLKQFDSTVAYLADRHPAAQQYAALLVLSQMAPDRLTSADVMRLLQSQDNDLRTLAAAVLADRPEWASELTDPLIDQWHHAKSEPLKQRKIADVLAAWADRDDVSERLLQCLVGPQMSSGLRLVRDTRVATIPASWDTRIAERIDQANVQEQLAIAGWLANAELVATKHPALTQLLIALAQDDQTTLRNRLLYASAIPSGVDAQTHRLSNLLAAALMSEDTDTQSRGNEVVRRLPLDVAAAKEILSRLDQATPTMLPAMVEAIAGSGAGVAEELLDQLPDVKVAKTLQKEFLVGTYHRHPSLKPRAEKLAQALSAPPADIARKLAALQSDLPAGDSVRGMRVFHSKKAACANCHVMGHVGGDTGPELSRIGRSRSRLELLEAIVFPSSHIAQGYRSTRVLTVDGQVYSGIIAKETAEEMTLTTGIDRQITLTKSDIEDRSESNVSIMPAGLEQSMSMQDLADVVELLKVHTAR